jgi:hypothetical protein
MFWWEGGVLSQKIGISLLHAAKSDSRVTKMYSECFFFLPSSNYYKIILTITSVKTVPYHFLLCLPNSVYRLGSLRLLLYSSLT